MARLMVILGALMVTPIYFLNTLNDAAALLLAREADYLSVFDKPQRDALVMVFLRMHHHGVVVNGFFPVMFGELAVMLWLIIMGAKERPPTSTAA